MKKANSKKSRIGLGAQIVAAVLLPLGGACGQQSLERVEKAVEKAYAAEHLPAETLHRALAGSDSAAYLLFDVRQPGEYAVSRIGPALQVDPEASADGRQQTVGGAQRVLGNVDHVDVIFCVLLLRFSLRRLFPRWRIRVVGRQLTLNASGEDDRGLGGCATSKFHCPRIALVAQEVTRFNRARDFCVGTEQRSEFKVFSILLFDESWDG